MKSVFLRALTPVAASALLLTAPAPALAEPNFSQDAIPQSWSSYDSVTTLPDTGSQEEDGTIMPRAFQATGSEGSCRLVVWDIGWDTNTNWLGVQGGRENCANAVGFRVELKKAIPWARDTVLGSASGWGNGILRAYSECRGRGDYYGYVVSDTGLKLRGDNAGVC